MEDDDTTAEFRRLVEASGLSRRRIAEMLYVSHRAVESYFGEGSTSRTPSRATVELLRLKLLAQRRKPGTPAVGDEVWILDPMVGAVEATVERVVHNRVFLRAGGRGSMPVVHDMEEWPEVAFRTRQEALLARREVLGGRLEALLAEADTVREAIERINKEISEG